MSGGNLTAVLKQVGEMVLEDQSIPKPSENQVLISKSMTFYATFKLVFCK